MALITLANYKSLAGITDTGDDTPLALLIAMVQARIEKFCNRLFEDGSTARTEYFDGDGMSGLLFPKYFPVVSVTSLHDDCDRSYGSANLIAATDYVAYDGRIELDGFVFNKGLKNIKLVYVGGYIVSGGTANVPDDLELALYKAVQWNWDRFRKISLASQSVADQNISVSFVVELPKDVRNDLRPYRRPAFGA